jgi:hypothetical protein
MSQSSAILFVVLVITSKSVVPRIVFDVYDDNVWYAFTFNTGLLLTINTISNILSFLIH